jgi:aryl-alcohol dehydrogenase
MSKNTTQIRAAVVREKGGPFNVETLTLEAPRRDEVLVKVVATGLCHTDMVARDKGYPVPHPIVLGHEGAGIVGERRSGCCQSRARRFCRAHIPDMRTL